MKDQKLYLVIDEGFAVCLTKDRSAVSCWASNQTDASMMTMAEAQTIKTYILRHGGDAQIVGRHCVIGQEAR